ncbi:dynein regulatory complex protein 10 isoform X2 [Scophthalmus maximus]|uniref:dynein regulatory complex protein 10 isoform X2 n=1 Tax=Scophthalmus maximus TaxID=52904 RepID=UPI0015E1353A|nr:dynein regulatory complex protein 10 isoform X2 [Scophthalmus maximus]
MNSMSANRAPVLAMTKSKTQSEDALKNLLEKRRLSVEAQRISSIVENCISQLEIAATLPAILCLNSDSSVVDEELMRALRKHQLSETRLERETLECIEQESEGEDEEARKRVKTPLEKDIKDSVRDLLRLLRSCPDAISGLREEQGMEVGESECELIMVLKMFHSHMVDKLQTSLDEDLQRVLSKPLSSPPAQDLEHITLLREEVATAEKQVDAKISRKKMEVTNLQESLEENNKQIAGLSLAQKCPPQISKKQASMQQEMGQLNIQLNNLMLENRRAERTLRKENEKVETEIEYLLQNFDSEMGKKQADLELNQIEYESGEEELRSLEKRFSVLESEYDQIMERRRLAEEKRQTEMRELELKIKAAIFAQAWWRGYSTRKALKNRGKSKTAKKGKGKKR